MNDDFSVDFSGAPRPNPAEREKVQKLTVDCFRVLAKSLLLKQQAEIASVAVMKFCEKYKNVNPDTVGWQEREKICDEANALMAVWRESIKKLKELDDEYEEVRQRVNTHYGKEIMPKRENPPGIEEMYKEILDEGDADWWKKGG
jgi:hypothetical protein